MDTLVISAHGRSLGPIDPSVFRRFRNINIVTFSYYGQYAYISSLFPLLWGIKNGGNRFVKRLVTELKMRRDADLPTQRALFPFSEDRDKNLEYIYEETDEPYSNTVFEDDPYADLVNNVIKTSGREMISLYDKDSSIYDISFTANPKEIGIRMPKEEAKLYDLFEAFNLNEESIRRRWSADKLVMLDAWKDDHMNNQPIPAVIDSDRMYINDGFYQMRSSRDIDSFDAFPESMLDSGNDNILIPVSGMHHMYYMYGLSNHLFQESERGNSTTLKDIVQSIPSDIEDNDIYIFLIMCRRAGSHIQYPYMYDRPSDISVIDRLASIRLSDDYMQMPSSMFTLEHKKPVEKVTHRLPRMRSREDDIPERSTRTRYRIQSRRPIYKRGYRQRRYRR